MKRYLSLEALAAHCTSTISTYCVFRRHRGYNAFIDQLTAGLVEVLPDPNPDGSKRYQITEKARQIFTKKVPGSVPIDEPAPAVQLVDFEDKIEAQPEKVTTWDDVRVVDNDWDPVPASEVRYNSNFARDWDSIIEPTGYISETELTAGEKSEVSEENKTDQNKPENQKYNRHLSNKSKFAKKPMFGSKSSVISQSFSSPPAELAVRNLRNGFDLLNLQKKDDAEWW